MRTQLMWIRALTATVLFVILAKANVWANTQNHLVLAVGYRAFLLAAPLFVYFGTSVSRNLPQSIYLSGIIGVICFILGLFLISELHFLDSLKSRILIAHNLLLKSKI